MNDNKHKIMGAVNAVLMYSQILNEAIVAGWEEEDCLLTGRHTEEVHRKMTEAVRHLRKSLEAFKPFERVAEERKVTARV